MYVHMAAKGVAEVHLAKPKAALHLPAQGQPTLKVQHTELSAYSGECIL